MTSVKIETRYLLVHCLAFFLIGLASVALIGYVFDIEHLHAWGRNTTPMAISTATGFFITGVAVMLLSKYGRK